MTAFALALAMGWLDPDEMLDTMPPALMREWEEFDEIRGIGHERLIHTVARAGSAASGAFSGKPIDYWHFIPGAEDPDQDPETMKAICSVIATQHNAAME